MSLNAFQTLIAELGQSSGSDGMAAGDDGYIGLKIDDRDIHIQYEPEEDVVVLFARLQEADPERRAAIYSMLLAANLFWQGTRGATFSADFDTGRIFLADRQACPSLNVELMSAWIERFASTVGYWVDKIESANDGGPLSTEVESVLLTPASDGMPPGNYFA